ncbi:MAG: type I 3-dehydroquinate dehydratase, partial [Planctomycetota bacterium]
MSTKLAIPVSADTIEKAQQQIDVAVKIGADIIELRTDYLKDLDASMVIELVNTAKSLNGPAVLVTCRDSKEGGIGEHSADLRIQVLTQALEAGAGFIDIEFCNYLQKEVQQKIKNALNKKFNNIDNLYQDIKDCQPSAIAKLVYTANHINDCFPAFDFLRKAKEDVITLCMGRAGLISRIIAAKLGGFLTFGSLDAENTTAPGQLTAKELKELYRFDSINKNTELYGVIGSPVDHSASPAGFNACFDEVAMDNLYLPLLIEGGRQEFNSFMDNVIARPWLNFKGFSVTIPHKHNALDYAKSSRGSVEPLTDRIGAANTLIIDSDGKLGAYNTDYAGALGAITQTLQIETEDLKDYPVAVVGAGGVSRAIVAALSDIPAKVKIYNRTVEKGRRLAEEFNCEFAGLDGLPDLDAKLLINCTSLGMYPDIDQTPVPADFINKDMAVFDTVY